MGNALGRNTLARGARRVAAATVALLGMNLLVPYLFDLPEPTLWGLLRSQRPPIVLIVVDSLRPDHMPAYGYPRSTSPNMGVLAFEGFVFDQVFAASGATNASIASLLTGCYPGSFLDPVPAGGEEADIAPTPLPQPLTTTAEALRDAGYHTLAYVDHPDVGIDQGYGQGFDDFAFLPHGWHEWRGTRGRDVLEDVGAQLDRAGPGPLFHYIHLVYPHRPYQAPDFYRDAFGPGFTDLAPEEKAAVVNRYDEEIRYADDVVGGIVGELRKRGLYERAWIVVTSGNGEGFWEHGLGAHDNSLYRELVWVPLIIHPPGGRDAARPVRVPDLLSLVDLHPTLLELAGATTPPPGSCDGVSFAPFLRRERRVYRGPLIFSEHAEGSAAPALSCMDGRFRLIYTPPDRAESVERIVRDVEEGRYTEFFDLRYDPTELHNAVRHFPFVAQRMGTLLGQHAERNRSRREAAGGVSGPS